MNAPYENLANAIIIRAANDYQKALKRSVKHPYNSLTLSVIQDIERFFRSDWFTVLTRIDPEMLIKKLILEVV